MRTTVGYGDPARGQVRKLLWQSGGMPLRTYGSNRAVCKAGGTSRAVCTDGLAGAVGQYALTGRRGRCTDGQAGAVGGMHGRGEAAGAGVGLSGSMLLVGAVGRYAPTSRVGLYAPTAGAPTRSRVVWTDEPGPRVELSGGMHRRAGARKVSFIKKSSPPFRLLNSQATGLMAGSRTSPPYAEDIHL